MCPSPGIDSLERLLFDLLRTHFRRMKETFQRREVSGIVHNLNKAKAFFMPSEFTGRLLLLHCPNIYRFDYVYFF
jgi:hypothetical protein